MNDAQEVQGGANHGRGVLIVHRWRRYDSGAGTLAHLHGYTSVCGKASTGSVMQLGPSAVKCKACFKPANTRTELPAP